MNIFSPDYSVFALIFTQTSTYSAVLDVYAKLGKVEEVISLYERGRTSSWKPDAVAFAVLGRMFGEVGDYDGIRYVLEEMNGASVEPNLVVYNTLLEAMGKMLHQIQLLLFLGAVLKPSSNLVQIRMEM